jgi:hypothetical protein
MNEWGVRIGRWILTGDNRSSQRKTCRSTTFPTTNPTYLVWDRTSTSSLRIQPSSAWVMARSQVRGKLMALTISDSYFTWENTFTFTFAPFSLCWSFYTSTAFWNKYSVKFFLAAIDVMGQKVNNCYKFESSVMLQCVIWYIVAWFFRVKQSKTSILCAWPWQWRQCASLKHWSIFANRHGIISQKSWTFISHVLKTSSLTLDSSHSVSMAPFLQYNYWCLFQDLWIESEKRVFMCICGRTMQHTS